ncbi:MAG: sigma-70 family RNA polymerase sigma factor [Acidimicrobiales bacterium]|nr:sigma-70 family RNA polymerase sigma factor [Acidimicrobiales bacterium]
MSEQSREERFEQLHGATLGAVRSYTRRLGAGPDLDDIVAETYIVAWRRLDEVPPDLDDAARWLRQVARYGLLNSRRAHRRRQALFDRARAVADTGHGTVGAADVAAQRRAVAAFASLPAPDQVVLLLTGWDGLVGRALAEQLGCSPSAAATRLSRARARLAAAMDRAEGGLRTACAVLYC